jgi:hypothetical protein
MKNGRRFGSPPKPYTPPEQPAGRINVTDPDSWTLKTPRGFLQGYNAQAVCNEQQIVVAAEVSVSSADFGQMGPMIDKARSELAAAGITQSPAVVLSDAGYWHGEQIDRLMGQGVQVLIPPDADKRRGTRSSWDGGRYAFMRNVLDTPAAGELYAQRQQMIEPVFADTKFNRRADRFLRRGRAAARWEWRLFTATGNLLKLWRNSIAPAAACQGLAAGPPPKLTARNNPHPQRLPREPPRPFATASMELGSARVIPHPRRALLLSCTRASVPESGVRRPLRTNGSSAGPPPAGCCFACDCERVRVTGGGAPRCRKTATWAQGKSLLSFRCGSSRWPRRRPASARKGRLAVLDPAHVAPLVIAVPTAADVLTRKRRPGRRRLGCRHSFGARFVHRDRGRGSVGRFDHVGFSQEARAVRGRVPRLAGRARLLAIGGHPVAGHAGPLGPVAGAQRARGRSAHRQGGERFPGRVSGRSRAVAGGERVATA